MHAPYIAGSALPLVDITAANVSFRTSVALRTDDADSSSPLVRSLLARVQKMDVQSAMPASGCGRLPTGYERHDECTLELMLSSGSLVLVSPVAVPIWHTQVSDRCTRGCAACGDGGIRARRRRHSQEEPIRRESFTAAQAVSQSPTARAAGTAPRHDPLSWTFCERVVPHALTRTWPHTVARSGISCCTTAVQEQWACAGFHSNGAADPRQAKHPGHTGLLARPAIRSSAAPHLAAAHQVCRRCSWTVRGLRMQRMEQAASVARRVQMQLRTPCSTATVTWAPASCTHPVGWR